MHYAVSRQNALAKNVPFIVVVVAVQNVALSYGPCLLYTSRCV